MGDLAKLDEQDRIWFCGRMAERVQAASGPLYTDCCEAIFNQHPDVFRSALIDLGRGRPAIVIEPEIRAVPRSAKQARAFREAMRELALGNDVTAEIDCFFLREIVSG